jgi:HEAT repeat protein
MLRSASSMTAPLTLLRRSLAVLLALACMVGPAMASAQAPSRSSVREMLGAFEATGTPAEREAAWQALGDDTVPVLVAIFDDHDEIQPVRLRAVWAARFFSTAASRTFLTRVASNRAEAGMVVRSAVQALAHAFGRSAVPTLSPLLRHADVAVREATIVALGQVGGADARAALEARRGRETELSELLERTLTATAP